jgi:polysaccharide export outer membrane protein
MKRAVLCGWLPALLLAGCSLFPSAGPSGREVIAQANPGDHIAFDVVKIDDAVMTVLRARREPPFHERFKKYIPPPEVKIAVGDIVSVIIWEAAANGLFGNSLAEWSVPSGVASQLLGTATSGTGALSTAG